MKWGINSEGRVQHLNHRRHSWARFASDRIVAQNMQGFGRVVHGNPWCSREGRVDAGRLQVGWKVVVIVVSW